ncbi:hypothetical protein [Hoylesella timonensis]|uniref:hypothetical protein n=1 Tax=Hoylesella timonensis TaxID=386414 RepID=UPI00242B9810|nr:hypothetical protein [Hoylesella timonensis]
MTNYKWMYKIKVLHILLNKFLNMMLHDIKHLLEEMEAKVGKSASNLLTEDEKIVHILTKHVLCKNLSCVQKAWDCLKRKEKLSDATLDKLALLAGFQNWKDLKIALHGENSAELNYDDEEEIAKK